jgi:hypothetical protein
MAILRLENNKPYTLALRYKAKEVSGQFGKQFQYFFLGGDIAYLPPIAHAEIESLHLDLGDAFTISKMQIEGQAIKWTVERVPQPKPMAQARSITSQPSQPITRPDLTTPQSQHLFKQLVATIEAVKAAEEFAVSINRPVTFTEADIRAMAISGFIESARRAA